MTDSYSYKGVIKTPGKIIAFLITFIILATFVSSCKAAEQSLRSIANPSTGSLKMSVSKSKISNGFYDPSITQDDKGRLWMSYSSVVPSRKYGSVFNKISTRVAYSDNKGVSWTDAGMVNPSEKVMLPPPHNWLAAAWENEVSSIEYNPYADKEHRWIIVWLRYLRVYDKKGPKSDPLFEHSWISFKSASSPTGPWSAERKLFAGKMYNSSNDSTIGRPEMRLDKLYSSNSKLGACLAFTEPGVLATKSGVYISAKCSTGTTEGKVVLLKCTPDLRSCNYRGALIKDDQARYYGSGFSGFSATELFRKGNSSYLMVTPIKQPGETYHGCLVFKIQSLDKAALVQKNGRPEKVLYVGGLPGSISGACGFNENLKDGVIFGQYSPQEPNFRLYNSKKFPR